MKQFFLTYQTLNLFNRTFQFHTEYMLLIPRNVLKWDQNESKTVFTGMVGKTGLTKQQLVVCSFIAWGQAEEEQAGIPVGS